MISLSLVIEGVLRRLVGSLVRQLKTFKAEVFTFHKSLKVASTPDFYEEAALLLRPLSLASKFT